MKSRTHQRCKGPLVSARASIVAPVIMTQPIFNPMPPLEYIPRIKKEPSIAKPTQAIERGYCY